MVDEPAADGAGPAPAPEGEMPNPAWVSRWARPWTAACRLCVRDTYHATHTEAITAATRHATLHGGRRG